MRYSTHFGLRLATAWEPIGNEPRLVASTQLNPRRFERPRWLDAGHAAPRAILLDWRDRQPIH
jgi:hypothetical protein